MDGVVLVEFFDANLNTISPKLDYIEKLRKSTN